MLDDGAVFEKAAVNFTHTRGRALPPAATARRPELAGRALRGGLGLADRAPAQSLRADLAREPALLRRRAATARRRAWWFGGGFDLTPYYGFEEDCRALAPHRARRLRAVRRRRLPALQEVVRRVLLPAAPRRAARHRRALLRRPRRGRLRALLRVLRSVGDHFLRGYLPIVERRRRTPYGERERDFQLYRRGRYVEFNLLYDRGTRFGLQSGGRIESILASLPPLAALALRLAAGAGHARGARSTTDFLRPRDWVRSSGEQYGSARCEQQRRAGLGHGTKRKMSPSPSTR